MKIVFIIIFLTASQSLFARQCWTRFSESEAARESGKTILQAQIVNTQYIFVAEAITTVKTVVSTKGEEPRISNISTEFLVGEYLKANGSIKINIQGQFGCGCHYEFTPGVNYLVFASPEEEAKDLVTVFCKNILPAQSEYVEFMKQELRKS